MAQTWQEGLRNRTKQFALRTIRLFQTLPKTEEARIIGRQLLRSATSVAANYRACGRARSKAEFVAKMGVVVEEADETLFWLELLAEGGIVKAAFLNDLTKESHELLAIFFASRRTAMKSGERVNGPAGQQTAIKSGDRVNGSTGQQTAMKLNHATPASRILHEDFNHPD